MPFFLSACLRQRLVRPLPVLVVSLLFSLIALAQNNLRYRLLNGYSLGGDAPVNKGKPTLFISEQASTFEQLFKPATTTGKRPDVANFASDMVIGIALPPTNTPPKLSVSRIFVQDSTLTVRYIRIADTSLTNNPQSTTTQPMLLLAIPKQTVLKARLVENGKVVQTIQKKEDGN